VLPVGTMLEMPTKTAAGSDGSQTARRTQQQRSETTTSELIEAARSLFAAKGYEATSLDDIVDAAGMTKGALYHHFSGKRELFAAVFEQEERKLAEISANAYRRKRDPWEGLLAACRAYLEAALDPGVQRIAVLDGPSVLGWDELRTVEAKYTLAGMEHALQEIVDSGRIKRRPLKPLAHMLQGAVCDAALLVARSENQRATANQVTRDLRELLSGLS
jgi:AcrR family transcriptional regulator